MTGTTAKLFFKSTITALIVLLSAPLSASNEAMLELIKILRDKGSITAAEYGLLKDAATADGEKIAVSVSEIGKDVAEKIDATTKSMEMAGWTSKVKLKGDVRLRYQTEDKDSSKRRDRGRARYRLGVIAKPVSGWEVGAGLASGSSDRRSTNQTFTDTFSSKGINLDYSYAQYKFNDNFKVIGGKFKRKKYLYAPSDLLWDSDINPEGFSANYKFDSAGGTTFVNGGAWVLSEDKRSNDDPHLIYAQIGHQFGSENLFGTLAGTWYTIEDITSLEAYDSDGSNSDFKFSGIYSVSAEIGLKDFLNTGMKTSLFMDQVSNGDTSTGEDRGYLIGAKTSSGPWSLKYSYADLEQNAWPDIFPDSDRLGGLTGIKGHEIALSYKIMSNVAIDFDYYSVDDELKDGNQKLLQVDLKVKF